MNARLKKLVLLCIPSMLLGISPEASGDLDAEGVIKYRQGVMKAQAGYMGAMAQVVRGKAAYGPHLAGHARGLQRLAAIVPELFPEGSDFGETEARDKIWEEFEAFEAAADKSKQATAELVKAVDSADKAIVGEKFKAVGETCKGCHDKYREKKE